MPKAAETGAPAADELTHALNSCEPLDQLLQRNLSFHSRQRVSRTGVNASAERKMPIGVAADIDPVWIRKLGRITVGCANAQMHISVRGQLAASDLTVAGRTSVAELI